MCTVLLPPGDNPIAINKYIKLYDKDGLSCMKLTRRESLPPFTVQKAMSTCGLRSTFRNTKRKDMKIGTILILSPFIQKKIFGYTLYY